MALNLIMRFKFGKIPVQTLTSQIQFAVQSQTQKKGRKANADDNPKLQVSSQSRRKQPIDFYKLQEETIIFLGSETNKRN